MKQRAIKALLGMGILASLGLLIDFMNVPLISQMLYLSAPFVGILALIQKP